MISRRVLSVSAVVVALLIASFGVGAFFSQYDGTGMYGPGSEPSVPSIVSSEAFEPSKDQGGTEVQERMVIYAGYVSLETANIESSLSKIRHLAETSGGYVSGSSRSSHGSQASAEISIRISKDRFQSIVQEIENLGKILDERTTSEDITQQYIDVKARLVNLQKQEDRLHEILQMATTVDEVLRVENELARIRGQIDGLQGQINYLEGNVEMSLITITLIEPAPPFTPPGMNWGETFETAVVGLFTVLRGIIILSISLAPLLIVGVPAYYLYKRRRTRQPN